MVVKISLVSRGIAAGCPLTNVGWDTVVEKRQLALTSAVMSCLLKMGVQLKNVVWMTEGDPVARGGIGALSSTFNNDTSKGKWF